jgi:protease-4
LPPLVIPVRYAAPPPQLPPRPVSGGSALGSLFRAALVLFLALSLGLNLLLILFLFKAGNLGEEGAGHVIQHYYSGDQEAVDKVAVVKIDGVIMEGANAFAQQELDAAAMDPHVKAVVIRINSPGGSITASDDLHRRIKQLVDGTHPQQKGGKKRVVVSMGAVAASGGYYIAMPAEYIFAERTCITGSIGVYAAFPNVEGLAEKVGFSMTVIKKGEVKDSGSMFKPMTPEEKQMWQDMVDGAFAQFVDVVENGRPKLKGELRKAFTPDKEKNKDKGKANDDEKKTEYVRRLADGGIWTAGEAEKYGLIDKIGYQDDAIKKAAELAGLSSYKAVTYEKPMGLANLLLGAKSNPPATQDVAGRLEAAATPRLWYLAPQSELAGLLAAGQK